MGRAHYPRFFDPIRPKLAPRWHRRQVNGRDPREALFSATDAKFGELLEVKATSLARQADAPNAAALVLLAAFAQATGIVSQLPREASRVPCRYRRQFLESNQRALAPARARPRALVAAWTKEAHERRNRRARRDRHRRCKAASSASPPARRRCCACRRAATLGLLLPSCSRAARAAARACSSAPTTASSYRLDATSRRHRERRDQGDTRELPIAQETRDDGDDDGSDPNDEGRAALMEGSEAIAEAAIAAGCRFFTATR